MSARPLFERRPTTPEILDSRGVPIRAAAHEAAGYGRELAGWQPRTYSPDSELLPELKKLQARTDDMIRNNGIASGAVQTHLDNVIGSGLRLSAKPNWIALGVTDKAYARNWERTTEARFGLWANGLDCYCDASQVLTFNEMLAQGYRSYLVQFEILAVGDWIKEREGYENPTAIQMIDPKRLCNKDDAPDTMKRRGGVTFGARGEPRYYDIASHIEADLIGYDQPVRTWQTLSRNVQVPIGSGSFMDIGRRQVIHIFDRDKPGRTRGKNQGVVASLAKLKVLERFENAALEASILNAMYAAVITSSMDSASVAAMLGADPSSDPYLAYLKNIATFHQDANVRYNGAKTMHLFPGEEMELMTPKHPNAAFNSFEEAVLRYVAAGWNLSYEQLSRDYSKTNYSSARAAMLEGYRFFQGQQIRVGGRFASEIYALWLEAEMASGRVETPAGAPDFMSAKAAWCGAKWIGPGRSYINPLDEANASLVELKSGLTTLEKEAALRGEDWEEMTEQRAQQIARTREIETEYGLPPGSLALPDQTPAQSTGEARAPQRDEQRQPLQEQTA